jgi:spermidine/putrescine transport system permease protein
MSWKVILGYNGVLNSGLLGLGIIDEPSTALLYNSSAVIITLTHAWAAFAILPIFVSLEKIDRTLVEAAKDLGDGPIRSFLRVTLPLTLPGVVSALLIVMIPTVGDFVTPRLVGGKDGVMIANAIQAQFGKASNWPLGAALSVTTMLIVTLMAGATVLIIRAAQRLAR